MSLVRWEPFKDFPNLFGREAGRALGPLFAPRGGADAPWAPAADVIEDETSITLKLDLPGLAPEDIEVSAHDGVLQIKGERKFEKEEKKENFTRVERAYGCFARSFQLPDSVDPAAIAADQKNGTLTVKLPKTRPAKPGKVTVAVK